MRREGEIDAYFRAGEKQEKDEERDREQEGGEWKRW